MSDRNQVLDIESIIRILPLNQDAVLVDRVLEINPGQRILAIKNMTIAEPAFDGHFPGRPCFPGAMLIEVMGQVCTILAYATEPFDPKEQTVTLVGVNKTKFRRPAVPGDVVEIEAEKTQKRSNVWRFNVNAYVGDNLIAESGIVISIQDKDDTI